MTKTDGPLAADIQHAFQSLLADSDVTPFPCMTEEGKEVLAFDLEQRQRIAEARAWLLTSDGQEVLATLREDAKQRGAVEPIGETETETEPKPELQPQRPPKKKNKQRGKESNMQRKKKSRPKNQAAANPQTSGQPTKRQQELADLAERLKKKA